MHQRRSVRDLQTFVAFLTLQAAVSASEFLQAPDVVLPCGLSAFAFGLRFGRDRPCRRPWMRTGQARDDRTRRLRPESCAPASGSRSA
jgi:hypothetical protein